MPSHNSPRTRAPRGTLNPELIVDTAIDLIDRDGLAALSTRRLAGELAVRPMALYTHFRDKDAILAAVMTELLSRFEWPDPDVEDVEWLRQVMRAYFRLYTAYPALLQLDIQSTQKIDDVEAKITEQLYGRLARLNIDHRTAIGLLATLIRFVLGCATVYPTRHAWDEDPQHWERVRQEWARLPAEAYPSMHALTDDFPTFTQWDVFEFGLNAILAPLTEQG
ncbi:TetR/AcrR family transcriptional regulator [Nocardia panacis]|uniref:TetR/AcrR family transcriptional regulator n=1 Tax=Nocardia panacis TaxID=2340916 RepID=A0A3A4KCS3_9NOCA|nr:TetR/AcrR family transcriptional regulator [Nocardia panacis]RJO71449.1 TetR/AcrR family transcriptional regulator [Nocardia panacis]